ncbi:MAG TPA: hypothetical protein VFJ51_14780 [Nitrososphaeraceae archaeon]|nr:hypothetical protein [Nitrososphaeraceae archaeon]
MNTSHLIQQKEFWPWISGGRLIKFLKKYIPSKIETIGIDVSPFMMRSAKDNFGGDGSVKIVGYDLSNSIL